MSILIMGKESRETGINTVAQAQKHMSDGQFSDGSMGPKVEACIGFASMGKTAIICSLDKALEALQGTSGTRIVG